MAALHSRGLAIGAGIADDAGMDEDLQRDVERTPLLDPHERHIRQALREAEAAEAEGEVPVGAVIVRGGVLVGKAHNQVEQLKDPTAHAEILAITQAASAVGDWRLTDCVLYVTKEPCVMCAGAIVLARLPLVVWGMPDPLRGGAVSRFQVLATADLNHHPEFVSGVLEADCREVMQRFFRRLRAAAANPVEKPPPEPTI